jgi:RHS repeat-associated protein
LTWDVTSSSRVIDSQIRKLTSSGALTTVAGAFLASPACVDRSISSDGPADPLAAGAATFAIVRKLALAPDGTLYIAERTKLRRLRDGQVSTVASGFSQLYGVAIAGDGTLFVSDAAGKVHRISSDGDVTDFAGGGASTTDGVPATSAVLSSPQDIAIGPDGLVYVAETGDNRIRRINGDGTIQTVAGTRVAGLGGDGHPTATQLNRPGGLTFGPDGALYIIDSLNHRLRKISPKPGITLGGGAFGVASLDGQELFHFDASGRHRRTLDTHSGAAIHTFGYSGSALTSVTDVSGRVTTIARSGSSITLTAPDQQPTTLLLDAEQNLERVTRPDGTFYSFGYGPGRLLTSMKDPKANAEAGLPAVFEYDNGLLVTDTDARPGASPQTLDRSQLAGTTGWSVTHTTPPGRATEYRTELASGIRTRTVTRPDGTQAIERRREDGALVFTAPGGATYDQHLTAPDGTQVWKRTQRNPAYGGTTGLATDTLTRLPSGLTRTVTESAAATINPATGALLTEAITNTTNGVPSFITYDATTRTFTTTTRAGRTNERVLDLSGRVASLRVSGILPTSFEYDTAGRLSRIIHGTRNTDLDYFPGGSGLKSGYLESTQTYAGSSPPLTATTFDRDALGRVLFSTTGSATTATTWDENGNLESVTPPGQPIHILDYDAINQLTTYLPPAIPEAPAPGTSYLFDADRTLDTETRPGSVLLNPSYDAAGRLDSLAFPGGLLDHSYYGTTPPSGGAPGKLSGVLGAYGVNLAYQYDGSLTKKVTWSGLVSGAIEWTYDSDFVPTIETVTPGTGPAVPVHFGYDADDLPTCASLTTCNPAGADALTIARSPSNGFITSLTLGNVIEIFGYNDYGEPASQTSTYVATPLIALTYDSASFPRDALGRITRKRETLAGTTTNLDYTYDDQGRLTDVFRNGLAHEHFDYDDAGNRTLGYNAAAGTTHVGTYDDQDRLRTYGPWTYTYTPNGELSTKSGAGQTWTYGYDTLGNLLSVTLPSGTAITYLVDGQNRRVGKRVNGTLVKQWLYKDGLRPVAELNGSGAVVARFVYASDRSTPDFVVRGGSRYRVLTDQLGSPRMAVNVTNSSDVPFRAEYTAFGVQTMLSGTAADWMPFGFAGGMSDTETGLVRFGARDYDPEVGRWVSKDPVRFESDGPNQYRYATNDPTNYVDTNGLTSTLVLRPPPAVLGTGGAVVGGIAIGVAVAGILTDTVCRIQDIPDATPLPANDNAFPMPVPKVESPEPTPEGCKQIKQTICIPECTAGLPGTGKNFHGCITKCLAKHGCGNYWL